MRIFAVLAGAVLVAVAAGSAGASRATTIVWTLETPKCTGAQVETGDACYDPAGAMLAGSWQASASSASFTQPTYKLSFAYSIPASITTSGTVELSTTTDDVSDGAGADSKICVLTTFTIKESGDPCATAYAGAPGQSQTGTKTLTLEPGSST